MKNTIKLLEQDIERYKKEAKEREDEAFRYGMWCGIIIIFLGFILGFPIVLRILFPFN